ATTCPRQGQLRGTCQRRPPSCTASRCAHRPAEYRLWPSGSGYRLVARGCSARSHAARGVEEGSKVAGLTGGEMNLALTALDDECATVGYRETHGVSRGGPRRCMADFARTSDVLRRIDTG